MTFDDDDFVDFDVDDILTERDGPAAAVLISRRSWSWPRASIVDAAAAQYHYNLSNIYSLYRCFHSLMYATICTHMQQAVTLVANIDGRWLEERKKIK